VRALRAAQSLRENSSGDDAPQALKPPAGEITASAVAANSSRSSGKEASHDGASR
jgi:hypothetical protein